MASSERGRRLRALLLAAALATGGAAARAQGQEDAPPVQLDVTVLRVSDQPGELDPRIERIDRLLRGQIAYQSLSIVDMRHRDLPMDEVWKFELPNGQTVQLRPLESDKSGTLLSLDLEKGLQGDFKVRPGQPLIVGGRPYGDARLVLLVESR